MSTADDVRPNGTPAYFLGRAAAVWQAALLRSSRATPPIGRVSITRATGDAAEEMGPALNFLLALCDAASTSRRVHLQALALVDPRCRQPLDAVDPTCPSNR